MITERVEKFMHLADSLLHGQATAKRKEWEKLAMVIAPELVDAAYHKENSPGEHDRICSEACECLDKLTGAHISYLTPMGHRWFRFAPWAENEEGDAAEAEKSEMWYAKASDDTFSAVERSNFYDAILKTFFDRVATGTGAAMCEEDIDRMRLRFTHIPAGTYGFSENAWDEPDTFVRTLQMSANQLMQAFPDGQFSEQVHNAYSDLSKRYTDMFDVYHIVMPREEYSDAKFNEFDTSTYPFVSVYIERNEKTLIDEGGYTEFPFLVTRYNKVGKQVYGTSPFLKAQDIIDDIILNDDIAIEGAKKKVMPPVLAAPEMAGQIDTGAGGITIVPPQYANSALPREWALAGDNRDLLLNLERLEKKMKAITQVEFLEIISSVDKREMTAAEVNARMSEKVMAYAATFTRFKIDFAPFLIRILHCCVRLNLVSLEGNDVPEEVYVEDGDGNRYLNSPKVLYIGRMAQAMEIAQLQNVDACVSRAAELAHMNQQPEIMMVFDMEKVARGQAIAQGMPYRYFRKPREVQALKEQLQMAQDKQMLAQNQLQEAQAAEHSAKAAQTLATMENM